MSQAAWSDGCALFYLNSKGSEKVFIHIELTAIFIYKNKNLSKLGIEDNSLNLIKKKKRAYQNFKANTTTKDDLLEVFLLMLWKRHRCLQPPFLFDIVMEVLASLIREEKEIKGIKIIKEEIKHSLFAYDIII